MNVDGFNHAGIHSALRMRHPICGNNAGMPFDFPEVHDAQAILE
jgi:hypothetical protein